MGISKKDELRFKLIDEKALEMYNKGMSLNEISKSFGIKRHSLSNRLKDKYKIEITLNNKLSIDSTFFSEINEFSAYWIGFILADGSIEKNTGCVEVSSKDKEHIEKLKQHLKSHHKVSEKIINGNSYWRLSFQDNQITSDLKNTV